MQSKIFLIGLLALGLVLCRAEIVRAEIIPITAEASYELDVEFLADNLPIAKEYALEKARQHAVEQAGIYVQSYSELNNFNLTVDKITVIAGAILNVGKTEYRVAHDVDPSGKKIAIVCKLTADVDTSRISLEDIIGNDQLLDAIAEKDRIIAELLNREQTDSNQRQFLIAKYERDLDVYNLDSQINWLQLMETARKLSALDSQNSAAFRATTLYYRNNEDMRTVAEYCRSVLDESTTPLLTIEALSQLGDIYFNEFNDKTTAREYVDRAIALTKQQYTPAQIEELVNDVNVELVEYKMSGRSNTIHELYVLKSDLEDRIPSFRSKTVLEDYTLTEDRIYAIKYRTDW